MLSYIRSFLCISQCWRSKNKSYENDFLGKIIYIDTVRWKTFKCRGNTKSFWGKLQQPCRETQALLKRTKTPREATVWALVLVRHTSHCPHITLLCSTELACWPAVADGPREDPGLAEGPACHRARASIASTLAFDSAIQPLNRTDFQLKASNFLQNLGE